MCRNFSRTGTEFWVKSVDHQDIRTRSVKKKEDEGEGYHRIPQ